jgi:signal transduction histidine kinase
VVITGYATVDTAIEAMKAGAYDFLPKPFSPDQLRMITARGLERRRLQLASSRLEVEREMLKRRFVSFVSHQLKSPIAAVEQYLEVLNRLAGTPDVEARRGEWIERCLERTREMRGLIEEWLTLARVEGDHLVGRREPVDLAPVLAHLVAVHGDEASRRGVTLGLEPVAAELVVEGDTTCLSVLFENLLDNAIKYNREGGSVTVAAGEAAGEVVVEVRDTGEGIPQEARPLLFEEFYRVPRTGGAKVRGSGLGLPICRRIATELGGHIEVESTAGTGSTFRVRLPAFHAPRADDGPAEADRGTARESDREATAVAAAETTG